MRILSETVPQSPSEIEFGALPSNLISGGIIFTNFPENQNDHSVCILPTCVSVHSTLTKVDIM